MPQSVERERSEDPSTIASRPTVASPGAISSRTARATIQFPDQSMSVAKSTIQAVNAWRAIIHCVLRSTDAILRAAGRSLAYEWIGEARDGGRTLLFLHEGLGSVRQ